MIENILLESQEGGANYRINWQSHFSILRAPGALNTENTVRANACGRAKSNKKKRQTDKQADRWKKRRKGVLSESINAHGNRYSIFLALRNFFSFLWQVAIIQPTLPINRSIHSPCNTRESAQAHARAQKSSAIRSHTLHCGSELPRVETEVLGHSLVCSLVR